MNLKEKLNKAIEIGIPIKTIAKYSGYNETYISKYNRGILQVSERCEKSITDGLQKLISDMEELKDE